MDEGHCMTSTRHFKKTALAAIVCAICAPVMAASEVVVEQKRATVAGKQFTFTKFVDEKGVMHSGIFDERGRRVEEKSIPSGRSELIDPRVLNWMKRVESTGQTDATLLVDIALDLQIAAEQERPEVGEAEQIDGRTLAGTINGRKMTHEDMNAYADGLAKQQLAKQLRQAAARSEAVARWIEHHKLGEAEGITQALAQGGSTLTLRLSSSQIKALVESRDEAVAGIELSIRGEDDINQAMADTNITGWALPFSTTRGNGIGLYMTESGCAADWRFTNYDRLAGSETNHSRNVGTIIRTVSPDSYFYCRGGAVLPQNSDLDGVGGNPPIYIVTRSNSTNDNTNYTTLDRSWDNFSYDNNLVVFNSGGNTGNGTGNVRSPGKGLNIVTIGNYNDATDGINSSSPFNDPQTGNDKPEVAAPGTNITAGGFTMSGTSQSTPHAAAFTADMMSNSTYLKYRPYLAKAKLLAGATDPIAGGYDKVGLGGIDFRSAQWSGYWSWWSGGNSSWSYFDGLDGSNDGYVTRTIYISNSWNKVRVALAWMNRGSYTYSHRNDVHPIGTDLDLKVYAPNGSYVGGSFSWDNPFESVNFTPTVSGYYTFRINRYANRDQNSAVRMGMYVNYHN